MVTRATQRVRHNEASSPSSLKGCGVTTRNQELIGVVIVYRNDLVSFGCKLSSQLIQ